ncbi:MAG: hypothetical protein LW834_19705, partial [Cyanobium sp. 49614_E6]|nr:hypothetical protein [Cyanobium sp. 49614_E6]
MAGAGHGSSGFLIGVDGLPAIEVMPSRLQRPALGLMTAVARAFHPLTMDALLDLHDAPHHHCPGDAGLR